MTSLRTQFLVDRLAARDLGSPLTRARFSWRQIIVNHRQFGESAPPIRICLRAAVIRRSSRHMEQSARALNGWEAQTVSFVVTLDEIHYLLPASGIAAGRSRTSSTNANDIPNMRASVTQVLFL